MAFNFANPFPWLIRTAKQLLLSTNLEKNTYFSNPPFPSLTSVIAKLIKWAASHIVTGRWNIEDDSKLLNSVRIGEEKGVFTYCPSTLIPGI